MSDNQSTDSRVRHIEGFDPRRFITRVGGAEYLEVKWRLLWLRTYDPGASIRTELVSHENNVAVFKAHVYLTDSSGDATGYGSEGYDDFRDYLEKAETKAIGRALAALGFGTQFTPDFDFSDDGQKVVDAPVRPPAQRQSGAQQFPQNQGQQANRPPAQPGTGITERQISFIAQMAKEKGISERQLSAQLQDKYDVPALDQLERRDASNYIELLKAYQPVVPSSTPEHYEPVVDQVTGEIKEALDLEDIPF